MKKLIFLLPLLAISFITWGCARTDRDTDGESVKEKGTVYHDSSSNPTDSLKADLPTVLEFSATWCGPCKRQAPIFREAEKKYRGKINMRSIDVDAYPDLAQKYNIRGVPTFIFIDRQGKTLGEANFLDSDQLQNALDHLLTL